MRSKQLGRKIFSAQATNGVSLPINIADERNVSVIIFIAAGFATGTLKFQAAIGDPNAPAGNSEGNPDFSVARSVTNMWNYVQVINLDDGSPIDGSTGIPLTANGMYLVELNTDGLTTVSLEIAAATGAGAVTAVASAYGENK